MWPELPPGQPLARGGSESCEDALGCLAGPYSDSLSCCFFTMPRDVIKCCLLPVIMTVGTFTDVVVSKTQSPADNKSRSHPETALSAVLSTNLQSSGYNFSVDRATIRFFTQTSN